MEGRILFFNREAQIMFLSTLGGKNKKTNAPGVDFLSDEIGFLQEAYDRGLSQDQIKKAGRSKEFYRLTQMDFYFNPRTPGEKKEALVELRKIMLIIGGKP